MEESVKKAIRRIKKTGRDRFGAPLEPIKKEVIQMHIHPRHKRKGGE